MSKTILVILAITGFALTSHSQDLTLQCGAKKINCENGNKEHFEMLMHCPYEDTDSTNLPQPVLDNARKYLLKRIGQGFYSQLHYYGSQIVDFRKFNAIKKQKGWISSNANKKVKYAIQYFFTVQDSMRYYLTLVFDSSGKIISKNQLPDISLNNQFDQLLSVCTVRQLAGHDPIFKGEAKNISLEYASQLNSFVWQIEMPSIKGTKAEDRIHRFLLFNANTGMLVKRSTETRTTVCSHSRF